MRTPAVVLALSALAVAAELPVRHVVVYKNGVGYFERAGEVKAGESAQLAFKQSEMNDILKSLTVRDASGNVIIGLRYDSADPIENKLATFPFDISGEQTLLSAFLNALRGARISALSGADKISGIIMLARQTPATGQQPEREQLVLLLDSGDIRTVDLSAVTGLQFADPVLQDRLRDYLRILAQTISAEKRMITIDSAKDAARSLTASYMVPAPIWKSSYRLLFGPAGDPMLEGWAIVDNTSGEDWNGVRLALVSGRPISFISNLFEARNIQRQTADLPELAAVNPVLYEGAIATGVAEGVVGGVPGGVPGGTMGGVMGGVIGGISAAPPPPPPPPAFGERPQIIPRAVPRINDEAPSSVDVQNTAAREFADLFEYSFSQPVTIRAGEAAMLPFVQQKIGARKLLIYSDRSSRHPISAVELKNTTGKTLDGGPVTVFDSASYAGEALMATLKVGDERLIGYAVDLGTRITTKLDYGEDQIREVHLRRGIVTIRTVQRSIQTYTMRNIDQRAKTLVLEHPIRSEYRLVDMKPAETTGTAYRFEVKLAPGAEQSFPVTEEHEGKSSVAVNSLTPAILATYIEGRAISPAGRRALEQIAALQRSIDDLVQQARNVESEIQAMERDSERTRQNVISLNGVAGQAEQVQRYARQLSDLETRLAALRAQQPELTKQRTTVQSTLR